MSGKLYALSTGPGAADLITVRAARILGQLDVLYAPAGRKGGDSLALSIVREYLGAHTEVRCCHFPMSADSAEKEAVWNDVAAALAQEVAAGAISRAKISSAARCGWATASHSTARPKPCASPSTSMWLAL